MVKTPISSRGRGILHVGDALQHASGQHHIGLVRANSAARAFRMASRVSRSGLSSAMHKPAGQARFHIGAQTFQRWRRPVGGDHHPAAQIGKGVDGVEEFRRRGGASGRYAADRR